MSAKTRLVLGPLLYYWPVETRLDFYRRIAEEAPLDDVVLGETVCSKRTPFVREATLQAAEILRRGGKTVAFAALAMPVLPRERDDLAALCAQSDAETLVEANEAGALFLLSGKPHRVGPLFNAYNESTLGVLAARGARSVCLPWELDAAALEKLVPVALSLGLEVEAPVFGRMPLAVSARCYHARAHGLSKDSCQYVCGRDPEGLAVDTLNGEAFLRANGTQTLSGPIELLVPEALQLAEGGVSRLRLSPEAVDMVAVLKAYRAMLDGRVSASETLAALRSLLGARPVANGFFYGLEGAEWRQSA